MNTQEILDRLPNMSALVVGDICLDRWCTYDPDAADVSRETGIPRVGVICVEATPGAGGTIANNLAAMGVGRIEVLGAIGRDGFGHELKVALRGRGIASDLLVESEEIQTFTYSKLLNSETGEEDLPRVDFINTRPLPAAIEKKLVELLRSHAGRFDAILVSDQAETDSGGVVTAAIRDYLSAYAGQRPDRVVWVDSRRRGELFRRAVLKPNQKEAEEACRRAIGKVSLPDLRRHVEAPLLVVTQGAEGVVLIGEKGEHHIPTRKVERPVDICGAGDSFSAAAALALAVTGSAEEAVRMGNLAASVTIMKRGTGTASAGEIMEAERRFEL